MHKVGHYSETITLLAIQANAALTRVLLLEGPIPTSHSTTPAPVFRIGHAAPSAAVATVVSLTKTTVLPRTLVFQDPPSSRSTFVNVATENNRVPSPEDPHKPNSIAINPVLAKFASNAVKNFTNDSPNAMTRLHRILMALGPWEGCAVASVLVNSGWLVPDDVLFWSVHVVPLNDQDARQMPSVTRQNLKRQGDYGDGLGGDGYSTSVLAALNVALAEAFLFYLGWKTPKLLNSLEFHSPRSFIGDQTATTTRHSVSPHNHHSKFRGSEATIVVFGFNIFPNKGSQASETTSIRALSCSTQLVIRLRGRMRVRVKNPSAGAFDGFRVRE
ncbi:hypothetical protein BDN72DRAFT_864188 [Pluteus cervinus]|uniref:Uncharacterized protein n=1 Tax=Pluteus cervinus TaxID=181527 RepID=A0ACD3A4A9_9AGAR|nr:hypothetical protein BDN72DRAFT_864188 [Pluteus cervinus]